MARLLYMKNEKREVGTFEQKTLDDFYDKLECDCFDIAHLNIGGKYFDLFVDDNGLLKDDSLPGAVDEDMNVLLVGNIVFANHNAEGETTSLSDRDIDLIKSHMINVRCQYADGRGKMLKNVVASY